MLELPFCLPKINTALAACRHPEQSTTSSERDGGDFRWPPLNELAFSFQIVLIVSVIFFFRSRLQAFSFSYTNLAHPAPPYPTHPKEMLTTHPSDGNRPSSRQLWKNPTMSGQAAKKAAKASSKAWKIYMWLIMVANAFYLLARLGWLGGGGGGFPGFFGSVRWLSCLVAQYIFACFLSDGAAQAAAATSSSKSLGSSGHQDHFLDAFALCIAAQVFAAIEFRTRGNENWSWWLFAIVPVGVAFVAWSSFSGSKLQSMMGMGKKNEAEDADPEMEAKRKRRQDLKMKRAGVAQR